MTFCRVVHTNRFDSLFLFRRRKGNKLAKFYTVQNFRIDDLLKPMRAHTSDASQEKANTALRVRIAIHASFIVNCCLAVLQLYAAISSSSLALFASYVDAGGWKRARVGLDADQ